MIAQNGKKSGCSLSPRQYYCIVYATYNAKKPTMEADSNILLTY